MPVVVRRAQEIRTDAAVADQLERMLRDRRMLAAELAGRPAVRAWLTQKFLGVAGVPVDWDASAPASGQLAEHMQPQAPGEHAILRVADSVSGLDQLALASFEMINMEGARELSALWGKATARTLSRNEFAEQMSRVEHRALLAFQTFAHAQGLDPGPDDRMLASMLAAPEDYPSFHRWILGLRDYDPEVYWGRAFDSIPP
jgi:hypothetical protein